MNNTSTRDHCFLSLMLCACVVSLMPGQLPAQYTQRLPKLVGAGVSKTARQGYAVAASGDGSTMVVGCRDEVGGAWVFIRQGEKWVQQGGRLNGFDVEGGSFQGSSVGMSGDGNTLIIGGPADANGKGAAWIFTRSGSTWNQQGPKLAGTGLNGALYQGMAVALSADGMTAIIGGYRDSTCVAIAFIFERAGNSWSQTGIGLMGNDYAPTHYNNYFLSSLSVSVGLSADGSTAIVGGNLDDSYTGAAWIYVKNAGAWAQQGTKLIGAAGIGIRQGSSVSISGDGNTAVLGGYGKTWVFTRSIGVWSQQGGFLLGTGEAGTSYQGFSASISSDGNTVAVGGFRDNGAVGAAWLFTRSVGVWSQLGSKLTTNDGSGFSRMGNAVSLSGDGTVLLIGGWYDDFGTGAAWTFAKADTGWTQIGSKLVGTGGESRAGQGASVSVSANGRIAIVGGNSDSAGVGAAWVFSSDGKSWTQMGGKLVGSGANAIAPPGALAVAYRGSAVAVSGDGNTVIVGGYNDSATTYGARGAAWVFSRSGNTWQQQGSKLVGYEENPFGYQGYSVSLSADGNTALIGGPYDSDTSYVGAAWVFTRSGGVWSEQAKLVGSGAIGSSLQGTAVALSADGNTAIVGGPRDGDDGNFFVDPNGAAWIFTRSGNTWTERAKLMPNDEAGPAEAGISVAISGDGSTAVLGGASDNGGVGALWVFSRSGGAWSQRGSKIVGAGVQGTALFGGSVSISADGLTIMSGAAQDNNGVGASWIFVATGDGWIQNGQKIVGADAIGRAAEGASVSLSADGYSALAGGWGDNLDFGAAWSFDRAVEPVLASVHDVPADQGGRVRVRWNKSPNDTTGTAYPVTAYNVWRKIPSMTKPKTRAILPSGVENDTLATLYDFLQTVPAVGSTQYNLVVPTLADSVNSGFNDESFVVSAHTADQSRFWVSAPLEGHSVDNLGPVAPGNPVAQLAGASIQLTWQRPPDADILRFNVYAAVTGGFVADSSTLIGTAVGDAFLDPSPVPGKVNYFRIRAIDLHGNEGDLSSECGIPVPVSATFEVSQRWNLVSVPFQRDDYTVTTLYPGASSPAYTFAGGYVSEAALTHGRGYWLKFDAAQSVQMYGLYRTADTVHVVIGWNLIGSLSSAFSVNAVTTPTAGLSISPFYSYVNGGYAVADSIVPGRGYWVKSDRSGQLILTAPSGSVPASTSAQTVHPAIISSPGMPPDPPTGFEDARIPTEFALDQNYPNPFNPSTVIPYAVPVSGNIVLKIYDLLGREIATLKNGPENVGYHSVTWEAAGVPSGVYYYRLTAGSFVGTKRLILTK